MNHRSFRALVNAMSATVRGDGGSLERAIESADPDRFLGQAVRHRCAGLLLGAILDLKIRTPRVCALRARLAKHAASSVLDTMDVRSQLDAVVGALAGAQIPHALLKSAGRLYTGDEGPRWAQLFDIDVLVPRERMAAAATALQRNGYVAQYGDETVEFYRAHHHHWTPLVPKSGGKPVEVHGALAAENKISLACDWNALRPYFEPIGGAYTFRLDRFGRALHLAIHGLGLTRLSDAVAIAAAVREEPALLERLAEYASRERIQRIPLLATIAIAARMAGEPHAFTADVERYAAWALRREELPAALRGRVHLAEAWYANGGSLAGPATALAMPPLERTDGTHVGFVARARHVVGRSAASFAAAGYAALIVR